LQRLRLSEGSESSYQVNVDPTRLQAYGLSSTAWWRWCAAAIMSRQAGSSSLCGDRDNIRGRGYLRSIQDLENIAVTASEPGAPIRQSRTLGHQVGGAGSPRRGVSDSDAQPGRSLFPASSYMAPRTKRTGRASERVKSENQRNRAGSAVGVKIVPTSMTAPT